MPFRPLITDVITVDELEVLEIEGLREVLLPFAESEDGETTVAIRCRAELVWYDDGWHYNLGFSIDLIPDPDDPTEVRHMWSPWESFPFIPEEVRPHVLPTVQECYRAIARKLDTTPIYRVCHGAAGVPQRNETLTNTLQDEGYHISEDGTDDLGRAFWVMERKV